MPETTETITASMPPLVHRTGCPVESNPDDAALAARVETYTIADLVLHEAEAPAPPVAVVRCQQCGSASYSNGSTA